MVKVLFQSFEAGSNIVLVDKQTSDMVKVEKQKLKEPPTPNEALSSRVWKSVVRVSCRQ